MAGEHIPVLVTETVAALNLQPGDAAIDATVGSGGHARAILAATAPDGRLIAIDRDPDAIAAARAALADAAARITFITDSFDHLPDILHDHPHPPIRAVLSDLGLSSRQLADTDRGFSFQTDGPLDMRFDRERQTLTAADIVNTWPEAKLVSILRDYGQEPAARPLAARLVTERRKQTFRTTHQLAQAVAGIARGRRRGGSTHPATRTFQALRIAVNDELRILADFLPRALDALAPGGRLVTITFHSGEDRIVKQAFRTFATDGRARLLTKHVTKPTRDEIIRNPRSRSAKLRALERLA